MNLFSCPAGWRGAWASASRSWPRSWLQVGQGRDGRGWVGNQRVDSLKFTHVARLELARPFEGQVKRESRLLPDLEQRVRDVRQGPDGHIVCLLTDHTQGRLRRLEPGR
jgi:glucose/arabinose dehydrogenase